MVLDGPRPPRPAPPVRTSSIGLGPYAGLLRASLAIGVTTGFGFGLAVLLALAFRWPLGSWLALAQAHGQAQLLGFVALFVMAVGSVLFPRFLASPLRRPRLAAVGGLTLALGVALRAVTQPIEPSALRSTALFLSGVFEPLGFALFALPLWESARLSVQPPSVWRSYACAGFVALALALGLNAVAIAHLASGSGLVPFALDEALVHLELWGFVVPLTLAVALKIFPHFLLLRTPVADAFRPLLGLYLAGVALVTIGWLVLEWLPHLAEPMALIRALGAAFEGDGLVGFVVALRLYKVATRPSGTPRVTDPTRRWIRLAFAWLLLAAALAATFAVREALTGVGANFTEASAVRHALTMGYLLPLMAVMAGRILPIYSADVLGHGHLLPTIVRLLFAGAGLRAGEQLAGGYNIWAAPLVAAGGILATVGFVVLAIGLWSSTLRLPTPASESAGSARSDDSA